MKTNFLFLVTTFFLIQGCASIKSELIQKGGSNEAIQNAIKDFSNSKSRLYKKNSVFFISYYDTLNRMKLEKIDDSNAKWIEGEPYKEIVAVSLGINPSNLLLTEKIKIGSKGKLPSRYFEKDGKLFFWWDDDFPLTQETLDIYVKYNILQDDEDGLIKLPGYTIDDTQKGVDYYFCKNNLTNYKKIITNKGIGYYDAPMLDCAIK